jgi:hypothetical protein
VPTPPNENHLADRRYITVVLRLMVDERGRVTHGQLVEVANGRKQRFVGWRGLVRVVRSWLTSQGQEEEPDAEQKT